MGGGPIYSIEVGRFRVSKSLVIEGNRAHAPRADSALLKAVARARQWSEDLLMGRAQSVTEVAEREGVADRYVRRLMRLAFLAPEIVEAIVAGNQPTELTAEALAKRIDLPLLWTRKNKQWESPSPLASITSALSWLSTSPNRSLSCVEHDGTASLANRDFGRVLRANQQKVVFSGAAKSANDAAIARYFAVLKGVSPEIRTRWRSEVDSNSRFRCPTWGKLYRNSHFGTHFGPKNLGFSGLSLGFKSLLLHHPVPQVSDISENRSKSTRVRGFVLPGGPRESSKTALRRIIGQKLSSSHFGRSILTNWRIATKPRIRSIRSIAE